MSALWKTERYLGGDRVARYSLYFKPKLEETLVATIEKVDKDLGGDGNWHSWVKGVGDKYIASGEEKLEGAKLEELQSQVEDEVLAYYRGMAALWTQNASMLEQNTKEMRVERVRPYLEERLSEYDLEGVEVVDEDCSSVLSLMENGSTLEEAVGKVLENIRDVLDENLENV